MNAGPKISRGIHRMKNGEVEIDGTSIPCVYSGFETKQEVLEDGHGKNKTVDTVIVFPLYDLEGKPYDFSTYKIGSTYKLQDLFRRAVTFRFRAVTRDIDEASITSMCTDTKR